MNAESSTICNEIFTNNNHLISNSIATKMQVDFHINHRLFCGMPLTLCLIREGFDDGDSINSMRYIPSNSMVCTSNMIKMKLQGLGSFKWKQVMLRHIFLSPLTLLLMNLLVAWHCDICSRMSGIFKPPNWKWGRIRSRREQVHKYNSQNKQNQSCHQIAKLSSARGDRAKSRILGISDANCLSG